MTETRPAPVDAGARRAELAVRRELQAVHIVGMGIVLIMGWLASGIRDPRPDPDPG